MNIEDSSDEKIVIKNNIFNYKEFLVKDKIEVKERKLYEFGALFPYKKLYNILLVLREKQRKFEKRKEKGKIIQIKMQKVKDLERSNTKKKIKEKFENIMQIFRYKARSRNFRMNYKIENPKEMTFCPINNYKNNSSSKKAKINNDKSLNFFKTISNHSIYMKMNKNIKTKINDKSKLNKKYNLNNNFECNKTNLNQINLSKSSGKYIIKKNTKLKNIKPKNKKFKINKSSNQDKNNINSFNLNLQESFRTIRKKDKANNSKKYNFDSFYSNSNSKDYISTKGNIRKDFFRKIKEKINNNINKINKNDLNKIKNEESLIIKKNIKKINNNVINTPFKRLYKINKSKNNKISKGIVNNLFENKTNNSFFNLSYKNRNKKNFNYLISISIDNLTNKNINSNNRTYKRKINQGKNVISKNSFNNNYTFLNININKLDKNTFYKKEEPNNTMDNLYYFINKSNKISENQINTNLYKKDESKNSMENLYYSINRNNNISRNDINNNFIFKNLTYNNKTEYKTLETINNKETSKINRNTLKTSNNLTNKRKDILNLKINKINKNKRTIFRLNNISNIKKGYSTKLDNISSPPNYYSGIYNEKKYKNKNQIGKTLINNFLKSKTKRTMGCKINIKNNKSKNNNNDINLGLNLIQNFLKNSNSENKNIIKNVYVLKRNETSRNKKENNIIRLNINNNNNIFYNKLINN